MITVDNISTIMYNKIRAFIVIGALLQPPPCIASEFSEAFFAVARAITKSPKGRLLKRRIKHKMERSGVDVGYAAAAYGLTRETFTLRTGNFTIRYKRGTISANYVLDF